MTRNWLSAAASLRASVPRPLESQEHLKCRKERFGANCDAAHGARLESPPQPLDAHLLADGDALEAAWQAELRAMIAARRSSAEALAARAQSEAIVGRIEAARPLTVGGIKVKARAESWRSNGASLAPEADDQHADDVWTEMAELPRYDAPASRRKTTAGA